ncbi:hypothetical protein Ciccas_005713, partial [Cichlidogyrus casuarinus]
MRRSYYLYAAAGLAIWYLITGWLCACVLPELNAESSLFRSTTSIVSTESTSSKQPKVNFLRKLVTLIKFKPYCILIWSSYTLKMANQVPNVIATILLSATVCTPIVQLICSRISKRITYFIGTFIIVSAIIGAMFIPEKPSPALFFPFFTFVGIGIAHMLLIPWSMLPDVISCYEERHGSELWIEESVFYSFFVFFTKLAVALSSAVQIVVLKLAKYRQDNPCNQPPEVGIYLRYTIFPFALLAMLISAMIMYFYPLDERKVVKEEIVANAKQNLPTWTHDPELIHEKSIANLKRSISSLKPHMSRMELESLDAAVVGTVGISAPTYFHNRFGASSRKHKRGRTVSESNDQRPKPTY